MAIYIGGPEGLTWDGAVAKVRGDLWRPGNSLPDDVVKRALHASVLELESASTWLWLEEVAAIVQMDDAAPNIFLPAVVGRVHSVSLRRNGWLERLDQLTIAPVREAAEGASGDPTWWALGDRVIWFDCAVPAGTEFELVVSTETPEILEEALEANSPTLQKHQQAVIANACSIVALGFMKNEAEAGRQRLIYERILDRLMDVEAEKRGGGVQPDTFGMGCRG